MNTYRVEIMNVTMVFDVCIVRAKNCGEAETKALQAIEAKYGKEDLHAGKVELLNVTFVK